MTARPKNKSNGSGGTAVQVPTVGLAVPFAMKLYSIVSAVDPSGYTVGDGDPQKGQEQMRQLKDAIQGALTIRGKPNEKGNRRGGSSRK